jgi:hypothetical protein
VPRSASRILAVLLLLGALGVGGVHPRPAGLDPSADQELRDLYGIFEMELGNNPIGNIYAGMGNRFQIDGLAYNHIFLALDACDRLRATLEASEFAAREASARRQLEAAQRHFQAVLENLTWPRYRLELRDTGLDLAGPAKLDLYAGIPRPVLLTVRNATARARSIEVRAEGLIQPAKLEVLAGATRHVLGMVDRAQPGAGTIHLVAVASPERLDRRLPLEAAATGVLEVKLADGGANGAPTAARVRITTLGGHYLPPERATYGLILKMFGTEHDQVARRWFYADGGFRVRAPVGRVKISIRKGLEHRSVETELEVPDAGTTRKTLTLERWIDMRRRGWHPADVHMHFLDPPTVRFEMTAEDVAVSNVLVMNQRGAITARQYFTGALDPISDARRLIYYNEEFRNEQLGHLVLLNLKRVVEPISTGRIGSAAPQFYRTAHFNLLDEPVVNHGDAGSPDRLLIDAMRETHRQGGLVNWAHLRHELEFPLDAALGELDTVDILTDTVLPDALTSWYHMLNCGLRLGATAGTDRDAPHIPIGHQRVYTRHDGPFSYAQWIDAIRKGASFVTNGPMVGLTVDGLGPGEEHVLSGPRRLRVEAWAESQIPFRTLDVVVNGEIARSAAAIDGGRRARLAFELPVSGPAWIAARALGDKHPEIMYYPHPEWSQPVGAHTSPVYVKYRDERLGVPASARVLLERLRKLETWARDEAYFGDERRKQEALETIARGMEIYRRIAER